jgi:hypothetical protein
MTRTDVPDAELLIAEGCPHCPAALQTMTDLLKGGRLGRLTVINLSRHPEEGESRGVRGVPWLRIGPFELAGAYQSAELAEWVDRAGTESGLAAYLREQLEQGELDRVTALCERDASMLRPLLGLAADPDTPFAVRIGIGAVLEHLGPLGLLDGLVNDIDRVLGHSEHSQVRADAAHFLGLTGASEARPALDRLADDAEASVREVATEALEQLD